MIDLEYSKLVEEILVNGEMRENNRTGIPALTIPHYHIKYDMSKGFPLLTTKKMSIKNIAVELEGFLNGITDKKWYQDRKCHIWDEWANPKAVDKKQIEWQEENCDKYEDFKQCVIDSCNHRKDFQKEENSLGPIYGYQWRYFNQPYKGQREANGDWTPSTDQLKNIVKSIEKNPNDRRMVCSAWNPNQIDMMALPPCHILWKVNVLAGRLHLCWFQRSCDTALGIPYNIASYAILQLLLCKQSGLQPGYLSGFLDDVHIYQPHIERLKEQITRNPYPSPTLDISHIKPFSFDDRKQLHVDWTHKDLALFDYQSHPSIKYEVAV